eukprot:4910550-Prymnesium_polylepis.1
MEQVGDSYRQIIDLINCENLKETPTFAQSRLERLGAASPRELDIAAMRSAITVAEASEVKEAALATARTALAKAVEAQEERDRALVEAMLAAVPFSVDVEKLQPAVDKAIAAGVAEPLVGLARTRLSAAGVSPSKRRQSAEQLFSRSLLSSSLEQATADAQSTEGKRKEAGKKATQSQQSTTQAVAKATKAVEKAEKAESRARNAMNKSMSKRELEDLWNSAAETRDQAAAAEKALHTAFTSAVEAAHEEEQVARVAMKSATE